MECNHDDHRAAAHTEAVRRTWQGRAFALVAVLAVACQGEAPQATATREGRGQVSSAVTSADQLRRVNGDGFGNPNNIGVGRVHVTQGYLFAGTWNNVEGMIVYRSRDG